MDRAERMAAIWGSVRRAREDRELASDFGTRFERDDAARDGVEGAQTPRCRHSSKPGPCSICLRPIVRRAAPSERSADPNQTTPYGRRARRRANGIESARDIPAHVPRPNARQRAQKRARTERPSTPFAAGDHRHPSPTDQEVGAGGDLSPEEPESC